MPLTEKYGIDQKKKNTKSIINTFRNIRKDHDMKPKSTEIFIQKSRKCLALNA